MKTNCRESEKECSLAEEIANAITHGIGAMLSIAGLTLLVVLAVRFDDGIRVFSAIVFGVSLILLYLVSTLYHSFHPPKVKSIFKTLDHCAIYLLIAGTYTPFMLISLKGAWGYSLMAIVWSLAVFGIFFKVFYYERFARISLFTYIAMGWLVIVASGEMLARVPSGGIYLLFFGGSAYTVGAIFYAWQRLPFNHAIWHLFVLSGSVCHFLAIYHYVIPIA